MDRFNKESVKQNLKEYFGIEVEKIELIGKGYDSEAYLIDDEYIFKFNINTNQKKSYYKEKSILDFLNNNLKLDIEIPKIEYFYTSKEISIMGYKKIDGIFFSPQIYNEMSLEQKENLIKDISTFLQELHNLDYTEINQFKIDNKANCLEELEILKQTIYDEFSDIEKQYIEKFFKKLESTKIFDDKKCLCHNDFSCNHLLLDKNYRLKGIIDWGDSGIIDEYCDFIYLLEDSEEEIGNEFGLEILKQYENLNISKAQEYVDITEEYYPIETIIYGIRNNRKDFIEKGRNIINERCKNVI